MEKRLTLILIVISFIISCDSANKEHKITVNEIRELESKLIPDSTSMMDQQTARKLIEAYNIYSSTNKTDSLAPEFLFKAGELAMNLNYSTQAIVYLNRFEKEFSDHVKMPYCIFFQAFIYENQMNNLDKAEKYYNRFINAYTDHELADDAATSIKNLGKPIEEIIKEFEKENPAGE